MSTPLKERVRDAVKRSFPNDRILIEVLQRDRLVVTVVSESFNGQPSVERKGRVRACLSDFAEDERALVVNVIADTLEEHLAYDETVPEPPPPRRA
jgi:stress-induced morphogen